MFLNLKGFDYTVYTQILHDALIAVHIELKCSILGKGVLYKTFLFK